MPDTNWTRSGPYDIDTLRFTEGNVLGHDPTLRDDIEYTTDSGSKELVYSDRPETVLSFFKRIVEAHPGRTALDFPDEDTSLTYEEWDRQASAVAATLQNEYNITKGDRVAIAMRNILPFPIAVLATLKIGAVALIVNARLSSRELKFILTHGDPSHVILDGAIRETYMEADPDVAGETFVTGPDTADYKSFDKLTGGDANYEEPDLAGKDTAFQIYTSGTTGKPKGVIATHTNVVTSVINFTIATDHAPEGPPTTLIAVPLFHVTGLIAQLFHITYLGGTSVVVEDFSTGQFLELAESRSITYFDGVPTIYSLLLGQEDMSAYDLSSWRGGMFGGAAMAPATIAELRETLPNLSIQNSYGATETTSGPATAMPDRHTDDHPESIGIPTPACELKVVDGNGDTLPPGEEGELAIRGGCVASEYHNNEEATETAFQAGWFHSGDIAVLHEEGFVELKGRKKRMITRGGENIYPLEVENVLTMHPKVLEAAIAPVDDAVLGSRLLAVIVPRPEERLTEDDIASFIESRLADYKRPELYRFVDELPKNASGKIDKPALVPEALSYGIGSSS
jgi:long-chain acyl-CoA synthetase